MRLVERDEQVRYLDRLMNECRGRRGQIVLLNGPTTTGKTELLRVCADRAPEDVRVLRATCSRAEQSLPFGVLSQLLRSDALPGELSARVEWLLREGASADAPSRPDHDAVEAAVVRIVHGLGVAVLDLAARAPLLIAVDDVQHADVPSLHCLLYIARRLASARVLVVLTDEAEFERQHSPFRAELRRQPHFHQLRLAPLTREGVAAVLQGGAGTPADDTPWPTPLPPTPLRPRPAPTTRHPGTPTRSSAPAEATPCSCTPSSRTGTSPASPAPRDTDSPC